MRPIRDGAMVCFAVLDGGARENNGVSRPQRILVLQSLGEDGEDHQVGEVEEKLAGGDTGGLSRFRGAGQEAEMLAAGQSAHFLERQAEQAGYFHIGEDLLAGTNPEHK